MLIQIVLLTKQQHLYHCISLFTSCHQVKYLPSLTIRKRKETLEWSVDPSFYFE